MTTSLRPNTHRIELARTRRMIEDTAVAAVPGVTVERLVADAGSDRRWTADVRSADGRQLRLRLDRSLGTVEVEPALVLAQAA